MVILYWSTYGWIIEKGREAIMKKYKKLTALVLAAAMIFAVCSCKASSPKAVIVKTVENEFDFPVYDKSDEEIADYIYKVTTGFRAGMTVEKWKNLIGFIPEFDEQEGNARSFEYGYGARMGTWPLKDNIQKIALYGYDNVNGKMEEVEPSQGVSRELEVIVVIADWDRARRIHDLLVEKYKKLNLSDHYEVWDEDDGKQTSCEYWSVNFSRDTNSRRYVNGDGGIYFSVIIEPEFISRK